ncbi:MAG: hypothetical protein E2O46_02145 [Ignavibacteria bacterium]|nr:MAG: hypothetical protein E2O46_02145 [Ignavibacteria bacterium]
MHKKKNCIYVLSLHPVFNTEAAPQFENLSLRDSILLYSHLLANFIEIFGDIDLGFELVFCLNEKDENYIPKIFFPDDSILFFNTSENINSKLEQLEQNYFSIFENNILIRADVIGVSEKTIQKIFNLLAIEDDVLVIGKSINKKVVLLGFNNPEINLLDEMFSAALDYDTFLLEAGKSDMFLNTLNGFQLIENFSDFKNLYIELSKKESLSYCSQQIHERFTNLFVEYKDLLNE